MTVNTIHAVLFDFGGVLAEEGFRNGLTALAMEQGLDVSSMHKQGMMAVYDSGFVLGSGTEADFWNLLRRRTGLLGDDQPLREKMLTGFIIRPWMLDLVKQLRNAGYITGILSDQTHWLDILDNKYHFYNAFDKIYNSYYMGKGKQDMSLFSDVVSDLDTQPGAVLFVDDDLGNVERAQAAGLKVIHYVDQEQFMVQIQSYTGSCLTGVF